MIARICVLTTLALSCGYGIRQFSGGFQRKYFTVALYGLMALFFSRLYYLTLFLFYRGDTVLSVGVLGQSAAYLFFLTANWKFLSRKFLENSKKRLCIPALCGSVLFIFFQIAAAVKIGRISEYITAVIYIAFMGTALYVAISVIYYRGDYAVCKCVTAFNICVCALIFISTLQLLCAAFFAENISAVCDGITALLSIPVILSMLPLLKRGMTTWIE